MIFQQGKTLVHLMAVAAQTDSYGEADTVGVAVSDLEQFGGAIMPSGVKSMAVRKIAGSSLAVSSLEAIPQADHSAFFFGFANGLEIFLLLAQRLGALSVMRLGLSRPLDYYGNT